MELPGSRFPSFYHEGPALHEEKIRAEAAVAAVTAASGWGGLRGLQEEELGHPGQDQRSRFIPLCDRITETWNPTEPVPLPLLPPNDDGGIFPAEESDLICAKQEHRRDTRPSRAGVTLSYSQQMGRLFRDRGDAAFQCMGRLLEPHCCLEENWRHKKCKEDNVFLYRVLKNLPATPTPDCPFPYGRHMIRSFFHLTGDWLPDLPPPLLSQLLQEGVAEDWKRLHFREENTGGAMCWAPYTGTSTGCLIYPRGATMSQLHFQQASLHWSGVKLRGNSAVFDLQLPVQQISSAEVDAVYVGARAGYSAAAWSFSADDPPRPAGVVRTKSPSTCVTVSPHLPGELTLCTESGNLYLWNLETGLRRVRQQRETLMFCDDPRWRWSDFTSHPRVLLYADRSGVQEADTRVADAVGPDLFRIGRESSCRQGERVTLARPLQVAHPAHYVVTTQFSVYIMDERFPLVPLVRWPHMMEGPPVMVSAVAGPGAGRTHKLLLGTQHSQETLLLQYGGGAARPLQLHLPATRLPRTRETLPHLDPIRPHKRDIAAQRLASPMAGLAAAHLPDVPESLVIFQLSEAGDVFSQRLTYKGRTAPSSAHKDPSSELHHDPTADPSSDKLSGPLNEGDAPLSTQKTLADPAEGGVSRTQLPEEDSEVVPANQTTSPAPEEPAEEAPPLSRAATRCLRRWLRTLFLYSAPRSRPFELPGRHIANLFNTDELRCSAPEVPELRDRLRQSMRSGRLLRLERPSPPDTADLAPAEPVRDPLSERLTAAWKDQLAPWWEEHLGLNRAGKIRALHEKRRRQKLRRGRSQSSLSSFSMASDFNFAEAGSAWSCDSAALSDYADAQNSEAELSSVWSFRSGPAQRPRPSHPCLLGDSAPTDLSIVSSQSLRSKGIPRERRKTLQDFISFFGREKDTPPHPNSAPPGSVQSQSSPPPSQRMSLRPQDSQQSLCQSQDAEWPSLSQRSNRLNGSQAPPSKRSRMGF